MSSPYNNSLRKKSSFSINENSDSQEQSSSSNNNLSPSGSQLFLGDRENEIIYPPMNSHLGPNNHSSINLVMKNTLKTDFSFNVSLPLAVLFDKERPKLSEEKIILFLSKDGIPFKPKNEKELALYLFVHWQFSCFIDILNYYGKNNFQDKLKFILKQKYNLFADKNLNTFNCRRIAKKSINNVKSFKTDFKFEVRLVHAKDCTELIKKDKILYLNKDLINIAMSSRGSLHFNIRVHILKHFLFFLINTQSVCEEDIEALTAFYNHMNIIENEMKKLEREKDKLKVSEKTCQKILMDFFGEKCEEETMENEIKNVKERLEKLVMLNDQDSLSLLEEVFIKLMGHQNHKIRKEAVILLNVLYDKTNFQLKTHFKSRFISVGYTNEELKIDIKINKNDYKEYSTILILSYPNQNFSEEGNMIGFFLPKKVINFDNEKNILSFNFGKVRHCGYYDWYLMKIKDGIYYNINAYFEHKEKLTEGKGRIVILNNEVKDLLIHELICDYLCNENEGDKSKSRRNSIMSAKLSGIICGIEHFNNRGTFHTLIDHLDYFAERGINCLSIIGALERDNEISFEADNKSIKNIDNPEAAPLAYISRDQVSNFLGGPLAFSTLVNKAKSKGIKIIIEGTTRIAAGNVGKQYQDLLLRYKDENRMIQPFYITEVDCLAKENLRPLNYRKIEAWNLFIKEILKLIKKYKIAGINLIDCQSYPEMYEIDEKELKRKGPKGEKIYSDLDYINGEVVITNKLTGFWNTDVFDEYCNPFLIKLTKTIWKKHPNFIFIGDCWGIDSKEFNIKNECYEKSDEYSFKSRERLLMRCGVIPKLYSFPITMSKIFYDVKNNNKKENRVNLPNIIQKWYTTMHKVMPKGSTIIQSFSSRFFPYPSVLLSAAQYAAANILFFLGDLPSTFLEEGDAGAKNVHSLFGFEKESNTEYYDEMEGLYRKVGLGIKRDLFFHLRSLRYLWQKYKIFRNGFTYFLPVLDIEGNKHPYVLAIARNFHGETLILLVNLSEKEQNFILDINELTECHEEELKNRNWKEEKKESFDKDYSDEDINNIIDGNVLLKDKSIADIFRENNRKKFKTYSNNELYQYNKEKDSIDEKNDNKDNINEHVASVEDIFNPTSIKHYLLGEFSYHFYKKQLYSYSSEAFLVKVLSENSSDRVEENRKSNEKMIEQISLPKNVESVDDFQLVIRLRNILEERNVEKFGKWFNKVSLILSKSKLNFSDLLSKISFLKPSNSMFFSKLRKRFYDYCLKYSKNTEKKSHKNKEIAINIYKEFVKENESISDNIDNINSKGVLPPNMVGTIEDGVIGNIGD